MTTQDFLNNIRELISKDDLKIALVQLKQVLKNSPKLDDALLQSARFNDLLNNIKLGVVGYEKASVAKTQISKGILDLIREIEEKGAQPAIHAELEKAIYRAEETNEYRKIKEKIHLNRGAGTSELLKDKNTDDLDVKELSRLFQTERVVLAFDDDALELTHTTEHKKLVHLSLAENGHIFKGSFLCLGKRNQIQTICPTATPSQFIIFKGTNRNHIFQLDTLNGNVIQQYEAMMRLLRKNIPLGRDRAKDEDIYEIPITAIREFIANAFVHRDYAYAVQSYIQVEIYDDRIEIKSPGHLPTNIDVNKIEGTILVNPTIAAVFHLYGYVERAGTGINVAQNVLLQNGLNRAYIENIDNPKMVKVTIQRHYNPTNGGIKISKYLGQSTFLPSFFVGRNPELQQIHDTLLNNQASILLISGAAGMGKTTLATAYYYRYADQYNHLAWISAREGIVNGLLSLSNAVGLRFEDGLDSEKRLALLIENLRNLEKPTLLIIDEADSVEELHKNAKILQSLPNFHILITSRIAFSDHFSVIHLAPFSVSESVELFKKYYPKHKDDENDLLINILKEIDYNTLIIEVLAKSLTSSNRLKVQYSLQELWASLTGSGKGLTPFQEALAGMYDPQKLSGDEKIMLTYFLTLPNKPIEFEILEKLAQNTEGVDNILLALAQKGWLEYNEQNATFKIQPLVKQVLKLL